MGNRLRIRPTRAVLAGVVLAALPMASFAFVSVGVSITVAPPALPVYVQPACPGIGYIWTPGYWAWDDGDYYWVPGTWVLAPSPGLLWTPGYWGWGGGLYVWHPGYWGPHVGFYGGINYGYGYTGVGFSGGYWRGRDFYYNRAVSNMGGLHVTNVYNRTVVNNVTVNRVSFNGGDHGVRARPNGHELAAEHDRHVDFTPVQREHEHMAFGNHDLRASANGGRPRIAATARPAIFTGRGVTEARSAGAPYHGGPNHNVEARGGAAHGPEARADRPAGAMGGGGRGPEMHADRPGGGRGAEMHTDRPAGAAGGPNHNVEARGGAARNMEMRGDRPPGAAGSGSAAIRGGAGGGAGSSRGVQIDRGGPDSHAVARNDRPPSAGGGSAMPHMNNQMGGERHMEAPRSPPRMEASHVQSAPRVETPHTQSAPRMEAPHTQSAPRMEAPRAQPRMEAPRMEAPRMQSMPRMESPHQQAAPQMRSAPHEQAGPRPEMRRGGGNEPHGQGGGPRPEMRGEQNHGRR